MAASDLRRIPSPRFEDVRVRDESLIDDMRATLRADRERARKRHQPSPPPAPETPAQSLDTEPAEGTQRDTRRKRFFRRGRS